MALDNQPESQKSTGKRQHETTGHAIIGIALISLMGRVAAECAFAGSGEAAPPTTTEAEGDPTLGELVEAFFRSDKVEQRATLVKSIERTAEGDLAAVAQAVGQVSLWSDLAGDEHRFWFESGDGDTIPVYFHLPIGYDPADRHPMIVCMPHAGMSPSQTLTLAIDVLGEPARGFVLISPQQPIGGSFYLPLSNAADLRLLLREARQRIHTDTDRVFLFGFGTGGDAAWMGAIAHPDLFAGLIVLSGYPPVPYPQQVYPFLLENLRGLAVLTVWSPSDDPTATTRQRTVADHNRTVLDIAEQASVYIVGVELPHDSGSVGWAVPTLRGGRAREEAAPNVDRSRSLTVPVRAKAGDEVSGMLGRARTALPRAVSHWFRYPAQGQAGWLRQAKFKGRPWQADQLSILPSPTTDDDEFISNVIKAKMAYLGARVDGQTITIETHRCARIDLLLPDGLVDWHRPITVRCNGRSRYQGLVRPSISTLLETAYEDWEFQRLTVARLSFSIKTDARRR